MKRIVPRLLSFASFAIALAVILGMTAPPLVAATWYVRSDGGTPTQCTGSADAPYSGSGALQPCAWDHPFRALPPMGIPRIAGGDTLVIAAGSYMMGFGAPGSDECEADGAWDCVMPPVPSGHSAANPTKILGAGADRTELWGTERAAFVINLTGSSNVEISGLEITDHSDCVEWHSGPIACTRDEPPFGRWAARGIYAEDSSNVTLRNLDIHGLAATGIQAGRLGDWTLENVRIAANGSAGWDGDIDGEDSNSGVMRFTRWTVEWNGCGETWPGKQPMNCWAQTAGGYGDGVGTGATRGHWIIEDSAFLYNTSDGLDLLYVRPGGRIEIRRTRAEGNAGNQIKTAGPAHIENAVIVGNCGWFNGNPVTFDVDDCRAAGNALALLLYGGETVTVVNSTIASEGDCVIFAGCAETGSCTGSEKVLLRNNILIGAADFGDPNDRAAALYWEGLRDHSIDADYSIVHGAKVDECPGPHDFCGVDPLLISELIDEFDPRLRAGSIAIGTADPAHAPALDHLGRRRDRLPDIGALEHVEGGGRRRAVRHP